MCLVGASGLIGTAVLDESVGRSDMRVVSVARREFALPRGARTEVLVGLPDDWSALIGAARADVLVCALGTTIRAAGSQAAFRAVDHDLVVEVAQAARMAGIEHMIAVSSVGADRASRNFYLRTKGETEEDLGKLGFRRLDILRPGLLRGPRAEKRKLEGLGQAIAPVADLLVMHGKLRKYRSVRGSTVARTVFALVREKAQGRFVHDYDSMQRALRRAGE
ncbi:nucleoside-diphosphate sugar epimerase [Novosphingobium pentaromativorans US6-1]|nr:nucleoside-diphosphate sugar epimerase [Novosphingobium pentaromativorans US6-1]